MSHPHPDPLPPEEGEGVGRPEVSVVIPAFQEAQRIGATLEAIDAFLEKSGLAAEVVVVDDGSRDGTGEVVTRLAGAARSPVRLLQSPVNRGKGASVRRGMLAAAGDYACFCDADLSTPIECLPDVLAPLREGYDVAAGSRFLPASRVDVPEPWYRVRMGRVFNGCVRAVGLGDFADTQCGFKAFTREAARRIFSLQRIEGFGFDVEVLWIARRLGLRVAEVPVQWIYDPRSHVSPLRDGPAMLRDLVLIRWHDRRGRYAERSAAPNRRQTA